MKNYIYILFSILCLTSCFDDQGNYNYSELNAPHWMQDYSSNPYRVYPRVGNNVQIDGSKMFIWDKDAQKRADEVRYEWTFNDIVVGNDIKLDIPVSEFMDKLGLKQYSSSMGIFGVFNVVEKETGVSYMAKVLVWLNSYYSTYDWFILSEGEGETSNISSVRNLTMMVEGKATKVYEFEKDAYAKANEGRTIPGKPIRMNWSKSLDFGSQGCITAITSEAAYEMNAENLKYTSQLSDDFLDGAPESFQPINRVDINPSDANYPPCTFVANKNGEIYTRVQTPNYLGGKFLTEKYEVDDKGYNITLFGNSRYGGTVPCYDSKNRRIVMASVWRGEIRTGEGQGDVESYYRAKMTPLEIGDVNALKTINREGTEVLHLSFANHSSSDASGTNELYSVYFNLPNYPDQTLVYDFVVDNRSLTARDTYGYYSPSWFFIPYKITKDDIILVTGNNSYYCPKNISQRALFTVQSDNQLHYLERTAYSAEQPSFKVMSLPEAEGVVNNTFPARITAMTYDYFYSDGLIIGLENGDVYFYTFYDEVDDSVSFDNPKLLYHYNVGGKVVSFKQLGSRTSGKDNF